MASQEKAVKVAVVVVKIMKAAICPNRNYVIGENLKIQVGMGLNNLAKAFCCEEADDERIVDYISYLIYINKTRISSGYQWSWKQLFSQSLLNKYVSSTNKSGISYYVNRWLEENGLDKNELVRMIRIKGKHSMAKFVYMESEEKVKSRFLNTENGFLLCVSSTTGWSPMSNVCSKCNFKERCISVISNKYPELTRIKIKYGK